MSDRYATADVVAERGVRWLRKNAAVTVRCSGCTDRRVIATLTHVSGGWLLWTKAPSTGGIYQWVDDDESLTVSAWCPWGQRWFTASDVFEQMRTGGPVVDLPHDTGSRQDRRNARLFRPIDRHA